jgi:hypothetical protein
MAMWALRSEGRCWRGGKVIRKEERRELSSLLGRRSIGPQAAISGVEGKWLPAGRSGAGPEVRPKLARGVSAARAGKPALQGSWRTATGGARAQQKLAALTPLAGRRALQGRPGKNPRPGPNSHRRREERRRRPELVNMDG